GDCHQIDRASQEAADYPRPLPLIAASLRRYRRHAHGRRAPPAESAGRAAHVVARTVPSPAPVVVPGPVVSVGAASPVPAGPAWAGGPAGPGAAVRRERRRSSIASTARLSRSSALMLCIRTSWRASDMPEPAEEWM